MNLLKSALLSFSFMSAMTVHAGGVDTKSTDGNSAINVEFQTMHYTIELDGATGIEDFHSFINLKAPWKVSEVNDPEALKATLNGVDSNDSLDVVDVKSLTLKGLLNQTTEILDLRGLRTSTYLAHVKHSTEDDNTEYLTPGEYKDGYELLITPSLNSKGDLSLAYDFEANHLIEMQTIEKKEETLQIPDMSKVKMTGTVVLPEKRAFVTSYSTPQKDKGFWGNLASWFGFSDNHEIQLIIVYPKIV